jgi:hypothetical protein
MGHLQVGVKVSDDDIFAKNHKNAKASTDGHDIDY